jgi:phenylalanyl-tRNA synthetase beta chain
MKVPLSWLRDYVAVEAPLNELVERVSISIAGVERVFRRGVIDEDGNLGLYRVGRVLEAAKHPNADRLQLWRARWLPSTAPRSIRPRATTPNARAMSRST